MSFGMKHGITARLVCLFLASVAANHGLADNTTTMPDKQDAIIFIRHALAPGGGDPAEFDVSDCATQRNLSAQGRQQAAAIGQKLRSLGITDTVTHTSEWCRCTDTATLMDIGPVEAQPLLNSFFGKPAQGPEQLRKLRQWLRTVEGKGPLVLVTHQVVVTGMTSVFPSSGEMVVTTMDQDGQLAVISTVETELP